MARLYADENLPLPVTEELRRLGHDIVTCADAGQAGQALPDCAVLEFASSHGRAVLTLDRLHFVRLHRGSPNHAGIVVCSYDPDFMAQSRRIHAAITAHDHLAGLLVRVNRPNV